MPTIPSIRTSIENKDVLVLDEHAKNGTFRRDTRGRLIAYAGGFCVVFPYVISSGEKWAFRCWHSDVNNSKKRYEIISEAIRKSQLDFLCELIYVEKGINVDGEIYPTTRMRWIDGVTIKEYICQNKNSKQNLRNLAIDFLRMTQALHNLSLAHGDLQHGNILVDGNHRLYLVDYDSFYCPKLKGEADNVTGLPDYQHPARSANKSVSEKLDYFSELIIYLSILAISENPSLIDDYKVEDSERLLFSKEDFADIRNSKIYQDIYVLGKELRDLLDILEQYLKRSNIDQLRPFEVMLQEKKISFFASATKSVRKTQKVEIKWYVPFDADVAIKKENGKREKKVAKKGQISTTLTKDSTYELIVRTNDGHEIKKSVTINVYDESEIEFTADKHYVCPQLPILLSWSVKHAKKVWLDGKEVNPKGSKIVEQDKATTYTLKVKDEFGTKEKQVYIDMLPVPQVKAILVPTPNIVSNSSITVVQPKYNVDIKIPEIEIDWIKISIPKVPSLTDLGLKVELSPPLPKFNLMSSIKKVLKHIVTK